MDRLGVLIQVTGLLHDVDRLLVEIVLLSGPGGRRGHEYGKGKQPDVVAHSSLSFFFETRKRWEISRHRVVDMSETTPSFYLVRSSIQCPDTISVRLARQAQS